jgi:lipoyl(octanoyl) transferase
MISVVQLGRLDYAHGLRLQQKLVELRKEGKIGDVLLLLEHTPVITLGRNAKAANVLVSTEQLAARGVEVFECDRGGDVTFHGPGQMVGYPIFDLRGFERSSQFSVLSSQKNSAQEDGSQVSGVGSQESRFQLSALGFQRKPDRTASLPATRKTLGAVDYVRRLEEVLICTCADFGIAAKRIAGLTGVWTETEGVEAGLRPEQSGSKTRSHTEEAKIAAIGVHISRGVTSHGFALNVNTDLEFFNLIVPCGIAAKPVTSMQRVIGQAPEMDAVAQSLVRNFGLVFGRHMRWVDTIDALCGNVIGVPLRRPKELRELHQEEDSAWA